MKGAIILALTVIFGAVRALIAFPGQSVITTPSSSVCVDKLPTCNLLDTSFYCSGDYYGYALEHCQKTCGLCNEHTNPKTGDVFAIQARSQSSFCTYKGQYYIQDQTWTDGCSQSCTCTNADQGMYSCRAV